MNYPARRPGTERLKAGEVGRPRIAIPLDEFERVCQIHPTQAEIAAYFGVAVGVIRARLTEDSYREAWQRARAKGKLSLRKMTWDQAASGNGAMLRYLDEKHLFAKPDPVKPTTGAAQSPLEEQVAQAQDEMIDPAEIARAYMPTKAQREDIDNQLESEY